MMSAHNYSLNTASGFGSSSGSLNKWPAISRRHWMSISRTEISPSITREYPICSINTRTIPCLFTSSTQKRKTQKPKAIPFVNLKLGLKQWKTEGDFFPPLDVWRNFFRVCGTLQGASPLPGPQPQTLAPAEFLLAMEESTPTRLVPPSILTFKTDRKRRLLTGKQEPCSDWASHNYTILNKAIWDITIECRQDSFLAT